MADRLAVEMINGKGCGRMLVIIMMTFYKQYQQGVLSVPAGTGP